ncbi:MAG: RpiB/LacA/LacB family sugar-phosphate isomerase [Armatimonadetes bacterium]|nr:RpiB/LacA/LacB family sugar-phosphate isomerase [Armatimonadota bacterium]
MRLVFGSDHAGFEFRTGLANVARSWGHEVQEVGAMSTEPYDYPDAADAATAEILAGRADLGVLICGTGIGVSIRANRHLGIRAAVCCSVDAAILARQHNHANFLCLGARLTQPDTGTAVLRAFLETGEDHNERHERRVRKLDGNVS